uniref:Uncharacterized protein n=1 Tax=Laticauda laticaudata TaxID=8630 RepID=A0A8C5RLL6_LATLA
MRKKLTNYSGILKSDLTMSPIFTTIVKSCDQNVVAWQLDAFTMVAVYRGILFYYILLIQETSSTLTQ